MTTSDVPADPTIDPDLAPPEPRRVVGELVETEPQEHEDPEVTELTDEERSSFVSLLTCGKHSKKITVMGHPVVIQTLKTGDEMRVGLFTKKYLESQMGFQRAYQVAVCAAGIREIQGKPLFRELREVTDEDEIFDKNVEAVMELYPIVITQIYQAIMDLEREYAQLAVKLGKTVRLDASTELEIRLAYKQGLLTQPSLNRYQRWALRYAIFMDRRLQLQDTEDMLQRQTWYLEPKRYHDLFLAGAFEPEPIAVAGRDMEEVVDDLDEVDAYFARLEGSQSMSGAQLFAALDEPDEEGWM
ncbi:hypothetical protein Cali_126 [Mycobacterium phage Cali]|uniref:Tail assembly chaperone n=11 Tax=Bixzunavirus TaxID=680114 RepID=Q853F3_BPMBZ|nr:tail assembly chaperone [Mycobacterium phage Bxz1]YP_002224598.1 tail assembly chaperone [Mycobacterium phage Cali]YP_008061385.1 tail assembly chaperone [Mycobacterium phage ArcherS7]YP_008061618.1 tail assembly chaperone [Mycobacterium phage Astraea]YP_009204683.1 tail assembly chaperone [Mycobacterium phage HyRo]ACU41647.1 hypothetical protein LRRHOOD_124 [Mycobacterium phage LRRHood]ATN87577.1 tail assembly chaperone [Mycobacterium phage BeanWater]AWY09841.1 tail assembly chaperone [M